MKGNQRRCGVVAPWNSRSSFGLSAKLVSTLSAGETSPLACVFGVDAFLLAGDTVRAVVFSEESGSAEAIIAASSASKLSKLEGRLWSELLLGKSCFSFSVISILILVSISRESRRMW